MVIFTLIWMLAYSLIHFGLDFSDRKLTKIADLDLRNRYLSTFHGFVCLALTGYAVFTSTQLVECGARATKEEYISLMFTTTYFIYDSFAMFRRPLCGLNFDI